jgi:hypothetical protein
MSTNHEPCHTPLNGLQAIVTFTEGNQVGAERAKEFTSAVSAATDSVVNRDLGNGVVELGDDALSALQAAFSEFYMPGIDMKDALKLAFGGMVLSGWVSTDAIARKAYTVIPARTLMVLTSTCM